MVILNIAFIAVIATAIVGFLAWSILTQYRHDGCADLRIRRRARDSVSPVSRHEQELARGATIAPQV